MNFPNSKLFLFELRVYFYEDQTLMLDKALPNNIDVRGVRSPCVTS
jgi:hypothetical protein